MVGRNMNTTPRAACAALLALLPIGSAHATLGVFEHGNGIKSMGMGVSDLSVALMVIERARARGIGHPIPHPVRAIPRWNPTAASAAQEATHE